MSGWYRDQYNFSFNVLFFLRFFGTDEVNLLSHFLLNFLFLRFANGKGRGKKFFLNSELNFFNSGPTIVVR